MTDPTTLRQGDEILVRAIVDRVIGDSTVNVHVGNATALVVGADIASLAAPAPRLFRYRAAQIDGPLVCLAQDGNRLWVKAGGEPFTVPLSWVEEISQGSDQS